MNETWVLLPLIPLPKNFAGSSFGEFCGLFYDLQKKRVPAKIFDSPQKFIPTGEISQVESYIDALCVKENDTTAHGKLQA